VYVAARRVLLNALDALGEHRAAVVLVGAQAIYLQAGEADLEVSVAPFTADADLSIDPARLAPDPRIAEAMTEAGFTLKVKADNGGIEPGTWLAPAKIEKRLCSSPSTSSFPKRSHPDEANATPVCPTTERTPPAGRQDSKRPSSTTPR
jgi:hypothetical protein